MNRHSILKTRAIRLAQKFAKKPDTAFFVDKGYKQHHIVAANMATESTSEMAASSGIRISQHGLKMLRNEALGIASWNRQHNVDPMILMRELQRTLQKITGWLVEREKMSNPDADKTANFFLANYVENAAIIRDEISLEKAKKIALGAAEKFWSEPGKSGGGTGPLLAKYLDLSIRHALVKIGVRSENCERVMRLLVSPLNRVASLITSQSSSPGNAAANLTRREKAMNEIYRTVEKLELPDEAMTAFKKHLAETLQEINAHVETSRKKSQ